MKSKHSKALLISAILGALYSIYLICYFTGAIGGSEGAEQVGAAMATALVTPHMVLVVLATIFNWVGYFTNKRGFALTGGILYSVSGVMFLIYIMFVIPSIVLSFVGYANLKKINNESDKVSNN
ncbi:MULTISPECIES: hypothetical protein [Clostridium]|uniref:DUF4064 domain-containing protein n=1 Tax=Clostridium cadaveris TaxID=1529 RepID=A0A1I2JUJ7_9CLOT|nr:hypothetical protein [Clostridium cadaveris]MDU4952338.1 hypothetical protein [Clostridium sp.]MDM8310538.1 hypothetical protein [Clostridium cadaveris]MDY4949925.1 hypothetical protein [Clostridium cadaveris]NME64374.1 hypothetical protein [Clostridium cadaveris]NWK12002.1 hypothetical protein [Clostridium cadaveris]